MDENEYKKYLKETVTIKSENGDDAPLELWPDLLALRTCLEDVAVGRMCNENTLFVIDTMINEFNKKVKEEYPYLDFKLILEK